MQKCDLSVLWNWWAEEAVGETLRAIIQYCLFIHLAVCLTTGPKPLPKRALHIVRSRASSFKWEYPLLSLRSSNSFLCLLPCLPVTSIPPFIFPSITRCRRQFLRKMWPIQFVFRLRISCRIFLYSLTLSKTSSFLTWSVQLIFSILLQHHISKLSRCFWSTARSVYLLYTSNKSLNRCNNFQLLIPTFIYSSTCFGRFPPIIRSSMTALSASAFTFV